ncbi:hypothetical protein [Microbacterium sp. SORGH_AS_0888]|uniref:hypothetical protein n=1 Tax=Microbacterium sp. SORGH_AS_0888 TaxID=3041791 RepID=UPI002780CEE2|nr:hypothetical protein [Microbacterium sp. SORGH_AS_0888]MDQ1130341.1 hypothetical protein [Microbacterium sp. SORGH_AS_0888]
MRRLVTLTAGWWWLAVACVLPGSIGITAFALLFFAGCTDRADTRHPRLCAEGDIGGVLLPISISVAAVILGAGLLMAVTCAIRNLPPRGTVYAVVLLVPAALSAAGTFGILLWFLPHGGLSMLPLLLASLAGVLLTAVAAPITWHVVHRRQQ